MSIHPLAVVSSDAVLGSECVVGPYAIIEPGVTIGRNCTIGAHVVIKTGTEIGEFNRIYEGAILGGAPQHTSPPDQLGKLIVGSHNTIREHSTLHLALHAGAATTMGDHNFLMVNSHVAHDCHVGSRIIMANNSLLGGHVLVEDQAFISGAVAVHQFCRVGRLAMLGGHARVVKDVPPYVTIDGISGYVVGLNLVGLRRAGHDQGEVEQIKKAYRLIYRSSLRWLDVLSELRKQFSQGAAAAFHPFLTATARGIVAERRMPPTATLKLRDESSDEAATQAAPTAEEAPLAKKRAG